ncbi:MAG: sugar ABC transporter substrate-binding protein [Chloroflexi bacterium CFX4]|nr:sugar ABC transporter substrate-binding protein [Chloroflexi bacterium CFX4]MDL1924063.1 sugar ABC transporter substrate-binding protein [Chloroflexi bacterium CFX3]
MKNAPFLKAISLTLAIAFAFAALLPAAPTTAQDNPLTAGVSDKFAGTELRLIFANHPWNNTIQRLIPAFEQASGMSLRIESYFEDQLSQKLQVGLTSGTSTADAFMFRPLQEGRLFAKNGWLFDVKEFAAADADWNWNDFQEAARGTVTFEDMIFGVPIVTERQVLYYRKDLFAAKGLSAPTTLEELEAAAAALNDPANGIAGIVMRGQRAAAVTQFSSFLYSFGGDWVKDGVSALDSPEARAAYEYYGRLLREYGPQGTTNMSWPQAVAILQQGKAAMWIDADSLFLNATDPTRSSVAAEIGFAPFPAGPAGSQPYNITSWALGINELSENHEAAWEFVKWATSAPVVAELQKSGNPGPRISVWESADGLAGFPEEYAEVAKLQSTRGVGYDRPRVIGVGRARDIVGAPIVTAIEGGNLEAALKEAHDQFNAFLKEDN